MQAEVVRPRPEISAATMVGSVALVLGRAEIRLGWRANPADAIREALEDHPVGPRTEATCRALWGTMFDGDREDGSNAETIRQTLARVGLLRAVLRHIRSAYRDDPGHRVALEEALGWSPDSAVGHDLRLLVDAFAAYSAMLREATSTRLDVSQMVEAMLVLVCD